VLPRLTPVAALVAAALLLAPSARSEPLAGAWTPAPPPALGTPTDLADRAAVAATWPAPRLALADRDRVLDPFAAFGSVLGPRFAPALLPATTRLLTEALYAASAAVVEAKERFVRLRPFAVDASLARCPGIELLEPARSWPSGHAAIGYAWAALLADLVPERADAILARGRDYGMSRVVCGFHWPSDVVEGQALGTAVAEALIGESRLASLRDAARAEMGRLGVP
jgi:acid phosphatase (class A)